VRRSAPIRPWLIAIGLALGPAVSNGFARFAYGLVLPAMREDLAWTYAEAGWIGTANAIGYLIGALLALRYIARVGAHPLFLGGMVLTAVSLLATGVTRDFGFVSFWRLLAGVGGAPVFIAGGAMASRLFTEDASRNALAIAVYVCGGGLGMLLSGLAIPLMLEAAGAQSWPQAWLLLGMASGVATLPSGLTAAAVSGEPRMAAQTRLAPIPVRAMGPALGAYFLFAIGYIVYVTFLVAWMRDQDADARQVALTWAVLGLGVMASPFPWRRVLAAAVGGAALALSLVATGVGTLIPMTMPGPLGTALSAAVFGLSFFIAPTAVTVFSRKNLPERQWGRAFALFTAVFAVGQTLGPILAGWLADQFASISVGLIAAGTTLLVAGAIALAQRPLSRSK
jgi:MFS family permease